MLGWRLRPCPLCGSRVKMSYTGAWYVHCTNPFCGVESRRYPTNGTARRCWNHRNRYEPETLEESAPRML